MAMRDNNSFLYPQGFHIGALYYIVKRLGDRDLSHPLNPETYSPQDYGLILGTFERECRYRIWALMEMGILEDHRLTNSHLSYQNLTEDGLRIYELMQEVSFPPTFFERRSDDSWAMMMMPMEYIQFTKELSGTDLDLFSELHSTITGMEACQDLVSYFLSSGTFEVSKHEIYSVYFSNPLVRDTFIRRGLTPPRQSYETSRRRLSVLIGLLESVGMMEGYSASVDEDIILTDIPLDLSVDREERIEAEAENVANDLTTPEIESKLRHLETHLSRVQPMTRRPSERGDEALHYPRNPGLVSLMKRKVNHTCQVCGTLGFDKPDGTLFIANHHMIPMNMGSEYGRNPDTPSNILIVCSWCHAKLEYGTQELKREIYDDLLERGIIDQEKIDELHRLNII